MPAPSSFWLGSSRPDEQSDRARDSDGHGLLLALSETTGSNPTTGQVGAVGKRQGLRAPPTSLAGANEPTPVASSR